MSNEIVQADLFNYSAIDADTTAYLQQNAQETRVLLKRTTEDMIKIGKNLLEAKARLPHGQFLPWVKAELGISQSTSWRFMQIAQGKQIGKSVTVDDLMEQISAPEEKQDPFTAATEFLNKSLDEATTLEELKIIRDRARELQNIAADRTLRLTRRMGQLLQGEEITEEQKSFMLNDLVPPVEESALTRPISNYGFNLKHKDGQRHVYVPIDGTLLEVDPSYAELCKGLWDRCEAMWTDTNFVTEEMRERDPIIRTLRQALDRLIANGVPTNDHHSWMSFGQVQCTGGTYMERPFDAMALENLLPLSEIRLDRERVHGRAKIEEDYLLHLTQILNDGYTFQDPVAVFYDGTTYWCADGFYRCYAAKRAGKTHIAAEIHQGTYRDAFLFGIRANSTHGLSDWERERSKNGIIHDE